MLVPVTQSFTLSQILFALFFSFTGLAFFIQQRFRFDTRLIRFVSILFVVALVTIGVGLLAQGGLQRSLSDGTRWIFLGIYIMVGYEASKRALPESFLIRSLNVYVLISVVFSLLVFVVPLHPLVDLFKGRLSNDILPFHFYRFSGFSGFPTDLGAVLTLVGCLLFVDTTNQYFSRWQKLFYIFIIALGMIGSASRGGVLHLGTAVLLVMGVKLVATLYTFTFKPARTIPYAAAILAALVVGIPYLLFAGTDLNVLQYLSVDVTSADESITHRFVEVQGAMDVLFNTYFLFGEDRALPLGLPVIEGFWTHLLLRYSWLGLGFGVLAFYLFTRYSFASTCVLCRGIGLWFVSFFITSAFFSDVLFRFKGPLIYGFLFGYCLYLSQKSTQTESLEPGAHVFL
jgi:hypothetical protein